MILQNEDIAPLPGGRCAAFRHRIGGGVWLQVGLCGREPSASEHGGGNLVPGAVETRFRPRGAWGPMQGAGGGGGPSGRATERAQGGI